MRVIVVGAGVAGLTASHCLQKANIDHVVVERGVVAPQEGASIAIYPHGCRILAQICALDAAKKACMPMDRWKNRRADGKVVMDNGFFHHVKENHGQDILLLERREFLEILYNTLPDKSRIQTGRKVIGVVETAEGVEVSMTDGTVEHGSMVLACDGVNSRVREMMWDHANKIDPGSILVRDKTAIKTTWKAIIGVSTRSPELGENEMTVVHNDKYSFLALTQPDKVFWFVFFKQTAPSSWPRRVRYSAADCAELAESVSDHPISETMVFGELYSRRIRSTLIPVEEGVLERWWFGRTVLAGDAAHKMTPNIALGGNSTIESIAVLCNHLNRLAKRQQGAPPSRAKLAHAFTAYQEERKTRMREIVQYSSFITKLQAKDGFIFDFAAHCVVPFLPDSLIANDLGRIIRAAPKLDYVDVPASFGRGSVPWADEDMDDGEVPTILPQSGSATPATSSERGDEAREAKESRSLPRKTVANLLQNGLSSEVRALGAVGALSSACYFMVFMQ